MSTRYIEFDGFQGAEDDQSLRISVINRGQSAFEMKRGDGMFRPVVPDVRGEVYDGKLTGSSNSLRLQVSGVQSRTPCEFQIEISNPAKFRNTINVYLLNSSAPLWRWIQDSIHIGLPQPHEPARGKAKGDKACKKAKRKIRAGRGVIVPIPSFIRM
jgi:hypothetical protein